MTMFLRPILGICLYPKREIRLVKNARRLSSSIKIDNDKFQLSVDVHHFNKDEIRVKALPEYVIIEGKQEKDTQQGYILREFIRKFKLPDGCIPSKIKCTLCPEGMLTIEAQISFKDLTIPAEPVLVPISYGQCQSENKDELIGPTPTEPEILVDHCNNYPNVKPKHPTE